MDKKDIYEHLAKIYLDASSKKKKKSRNYLQFLRNPLIISVIFVFGLSLVYFANFKRQKSFNSEVALVLLPEAAKINFNFDPAKKEIYSINLNNLNLGKYKALGFTLKKANSQDKISLRVEFISAFREKSEVYLKDIPHQWKDYVLNFSQFKNISEWSDMSGLCFIVEEWNAKEKKGVVYIDNVRFLK